MTAIPNNPPATLQQQTRALPNILRRAPQLLMRAIVFLCIGAIMTVLIAWALGLWADVESATVVTNSIPQRGRMWEISVWNTSGAMRLHSLRQAQSWGGWQATGPPDSPMTGDSSRAWCPASADSQAEWLILDYPQRVVPKEVHVYENYCPGALVRVTVFNESGEEIDAWRGKDPTSAGSVAGISKIPLDISFKTQRIKIYLDSPKAPGWNEIDAVGLLDENGNMQWASDMQESSSYANLNATAPPPFTLSEMVPPWCPLGQPDLTAPQKTQNPTTTDDRVFEARGWPMLALWTQRPDNPTATPIQIQGTAKYLSGRIIGRSTTPGALPPILPTRPIWSGLLFNTIFFGVFLASAYWLLVRPRRLLVELLRMRSGCCIACGYQLDFDFRSGCPECGWRRSHS